MRIIQIVTTLGYGDAVGNNILALKNYLISKGYSSCIYAEAIDKRIFDKDAMYVKDLPELKHDDIVLYHKATGTILTYQFGEYNCKKVLVYHNITPPHFFEGYNNDGANNASYGLEGLQSLRGKVDFCLADSEFNKNDLISFGFSCPIFVCPILIPFNDYERKPNEKIIRVLEDDWVNIIFVGRIVPNKKQEDIIKIFYYYKKYINPKSRLILVGSYNGMELYYKRLLNYIKALGLNDIIFTGHIEFEDMLAYYKIADIFLCMSEHEGFCVPLLEAMYFDVPIIAYNSTAVPYTLEGNGILVNEKNAPEIAKLIERVLLDESLKKKIINKQRERLKFFSYENVSHLFNDCIKTFIEVNNEK